MLNFIRQIVVVAVFMVSFCGAAYAAEFVTEDGLVGKTIVVYSDGINIVSENAQGFVIEQDVRGMKLIIPQAEIVFLDNQYMIISEETSVGTVTSTIRIDIPNGEYDPDMLWDYILCNN